MVFWLINLLTFITIIERYEVFAQQIGRVELCPQPPGTCTTTSYIQPVGQVCFPAVIQPIAPDYIQGPLPSQNNYPSSPQTSTSDDEWLSLICLLISTLFDNNNNGCRETNIPLGNNRNNICNNPNCIYPPSGPPQPCQYPTSSFPSIGDGFPQIDFPYVNNPTSGCIYVPYPIAVPIIPNGIPGFDVNDPFDDDVIDTPAVKETQEFNVVIRTEPC